MATDARLTLALYALWPWLLLDDPTMEAVLELLCVYTASFTTGLYVCVCVCVFRHGACPWGLSHMHSGLRAALSPLVTTEQHCVSLSHTSARLSASYNRHTLMATGSRPVGDDVWKIEHLCWLPLFLGQIQRF